jgi:hypothetical protein
VATPARDAAEFFRGMRGKPRQSRVGEVAGAQYGVISLEQLRQAGLGDDQVSRRLQRPDQSDEELEAAALVSDFDSDLVSDLDSDFESDPPESFDSFASRERLRVP